MDGVVIDSEKLHLRALGLTLEQNRIAYPEEIMNDFVGRSDTSFFVYAKEKLDDRVDIEKYIRQKDSLYLGLLPELQFVNGFTDFIRHIKAMGLQTALVTSSSHFSVGKADERLHFTRFFDVIVAEEDTVKHKPHPDPYLLAFEKTKADKNSTIIIEDSINGIKAGKAAQCIVCGLATSFGPDVLTGAGADYAFVNYEEIKNKFLK